jgi:hypothetical protein
MKKTIVFFLIYFISSQMNAQIQGQIKKSTITNQQTSNGNNQKILNQTTTKRSLTKPLPDLKFTAFNVSAVGSAGSSVYTVNVTCTVKNDGMASMLTDDITLQGYVSDLDWIQQSQDVRFTNHFKSAGGRILSDIPNRGETLAPGASKQISFSCTNLTLIKNPTPVYMITVNLWSDIEETDKDNNKTYMTILL